MPKIKQPEIFERDGFTFKRSESGGYRVSCDQCQAAVINGMAAHETGCIRIPKKCWECGYTGCDGHNEEDQ